MNTNLKIASRLSQIAGFLILLVSLISIFSGEFYYLFMENTRVATYQGQDIIALVSLPVFYLAINLAKKKSVPGLLIWLGLNGYYLYVYSIYAFNGIYSDLFLFYIAIISLSFFAIIRAMSAIEPSAINQYFSPKTPTKLISIYLILVALFQSIAWVSIILQHIRYKEPAPANAIYVLDLALLLPFFMLSAYWLWRKHGKAYLATPVLLIFSSLYGLAFIAGQTLKYYRNLEYHPLATYIFIIFTFIAIVLSFIFLFNKKNTEKKRNK